MIGSVHASEIQNFWPTQEREPAKLCKLFTHSARAPPAKSHARCSWQNLCKGLKRMSEENRWQPGASRIFFGFQKKYFEEFYLIHLSSFFYIQQFQVARVALQLSMLSQGNFTLFAQSELKF